MRHCLGCRAEYEDSKTVCAECGEPLEAGALPPEEPATWAVVRVVGGEDEGTLLCGFLRAEGIDAALDPAGSHTFSETIGDLSGLRVAVPVEQQAEAEKLLAERDRRMAGAEDPELDAAAEAAGSAETA